MSKLKVNEIGPFSGSGIGVGAPTNEPSAILDIKSSNQGIYIPRLTTTDRDLIISPKNGLIIYNLTTNALEHYNGTSWESVDGVQSINGLIAKNQIINNGFAGVTPNFTQTAPGTHTLNIPMASGTAVEAGLITNGEYESFNSRLFPIQNTKYVTKNPILGPQDYSSVKEAVDSITDADAENPYIVRIGPGVFEENTIAMKQFVWVQGSEQDQTVIKASNPNNSVVLGAPNSGISKCLITGSTGSGVPAILYQSADGSDKTSFFVEDVRFGNNDTHVIADGIYSPCSVFVEQGRLGGIYQFNTGFVAKNGGRVIMRNSTTTSVSTPVPADVFYATGTGSEIVLNGVQLRNGNSTAGNCIRLRDGARLRALSFNIKNWNRGIWLENVGAPCFIDVNGILTEGNAYDLVADHPGSDGTFAGSADHNKIVVNTSSFLSVVIACNANPSDHTGQVIVGSVLQGDRYDRLANLSKIARLATTLGVGEQVEASFIEVVSGLDVVVHSGTGFLLDPSELYLKEIFWSETPLTLSPDSTLFIYADTNGDIQAQPSLPSLETVIPLGRVNTTATDVRFIEDSDLSMNHIGNKIEFFLRNVLGPIFNSGCLITESILNNRKLDNTPGEYSYGVSGFEVAQGTEISWETFYRDGSGGFTSLGLQDTVSNTQYDDGSGTLASIPAGKYAKHHLYVLGEDAGQKWFLVQAQEAYNTLSEAIDGPSPIVPTFINGAVVRVAAIIVQQGVSTTVQIQDIRPRIGFAAPSGTAVTDHGSLTGLLDDDHPQYLLVGGSRSMTGSLNMGGQSITNVNLVDGVDVSSHATRHLPNGTDPLTTAAPTTAVGGNTANATGTANSLARSDHQHDVATGVVSTQVPDQANAEGTSNNLARADHTHNIPTAAPIGSLGATSTNTQGIAATFARSDHTHDIDTASPVAVIPGSSNAEGTSNSLSRADHAHAVPVGVPVSVSTANSAGAANSFARSDHVHAHGNIPGGSTHDAVTTTVNGYMSATDKVKLDGIEAGATADQNASEVPFTPTGDLSSTDVQAALAELDSEKQALSQKGQANGYAALDGSGKVPVAQLPDTVVGSVDYKGTWNANTNTPNLVIATPDKGDYYVVNVAGSTSLGSITDWKIGDWAIYNGITWEKVDNTDQVTSVFGRQGSVTAQDADYTASQVVYSNATSGLAATRVQAAIDEVEGRLDTAEALLNTHASRHLPNGADPLTTAAPIGALGGSSTNTVGTANSLARSDHAHDIATGVVSAQSPDQTSAEGTSDNLARADHVHNIPTAAAVGLSATTTNTQGNAATFARSNHTHAIATGAASTQTPDQANATGSSANVARADHVHNIPTASATGISTSTANAQGAASTFARSDHTHKVDIANYEVSATAAATTGSGTDVLMTGMTITPVSGTYLVVFSCFVNSSTDGAEITASIYVGGSRVTYTERDSTPRGVFGAGTDASVIATNCIASVNGSQAIEIRWRRTAGTATVNNRTMNLIKLT